jgi:nicotinamidase-related amidase
MTLADTTPYAWPYDGVLDASRTALVVCGLQRCWAELAPTVTAQVIALVPAARTAGLQVVLVQHARLRPTGRPGADLPLTGDAAAELLLTPADDDVVITASTHDGFLATPLDATLRARGVDHLVFVGLAAEVVVDSTLRSANDRGYECLTVIDATAPFDAHTGARTLDSITKSGGIFGAIGTSAAVADAYGLAIDQQ